MANYVVPYAPQGQPFTPNFRLVELLREQGSDAADAELRHGAINAQLANTLGQIPGQMIVAQRAEQERQIAQQKIDDYNQTQTGMKAVSAAMANFVTTHPDGSKTLDPEKLPAFLQQLSGPGADGQSAVHPAIIADALKSIDDINKTVGQFQTAKIDHQADLAHALLQGKLGKTPAGMTVGIETAVASGLATRQEAEQLKDAIAQTVAAGGDPADLLQHIRGRSEKYQKLGAPVKLGGAVRPGAGADTLVDPLNGGVIASGDPGQGLPSKFKEVAGTIPSPDGDRVPVQAAFDETTGKYSIAGKDVSEYFQPKEDKLKGPTAEDDKQQYRALRAKQAMGQALLPDQAAWLDAYDKEKVIGVDAASLAASKRQALAQEQQNKLQGQAQDFNKAQVARADIVKTVNTPYSTARAGAENLRELVKAAQGGNMTAASLQNMATTMAELRANGFNRMNIVELNASANAGSVWDRVQNWFGKATAGQPVDPKIQQDIKDLADLLDTAAYKKYAADHDAINGVYGTKIPRSFQPPASAAPPPPPPGPNPFPAGRGPVR